MDLDLPAAARFCSVVPPYLLRRLADAADPVLRDAGRRALLADAVHRQNRLTAPPPPPAPTRTRTAPATGTGTATARPERTICDDEPTETLPGRTVRREGAGAVQDGPVNRAYDALGATYALYREVYGRRSINGAGLPLDATVHYGEAYDNA